MAKADQHKAGELWDPTCTVSCVTCSLASVKRRTGGNRTPTAASFAAKLSLPGLYLAGKTSALRPSQGAFFRPQISQLVCRKYIESIDIAHLQATTSVAAPTLAGRPCRKLKLDLRPGVMRKRTLVATRLSVLAIFALQSGKRTLQSALTDCSAYFDRNICDACVAGAALPPAPHSIRARSLTSGSPQCGAQDTCNGQRFTIGQYYCLALGKTHHPISQR